MYCIGTSARGTLGRDPCLPIVMVHQQYPRHHTVRTSPGLSLLILPPLSTVRVRVRKVQTPALQTRVNSDRALLVFAFAFAFASVSVFVQALSLS